MRVYIRSYPDGVPRNKNFAIALEGFRELGAELIPFTDIRAVEFGGREDIVVGYVQDVRWRLESLGVDVPDVDYPDELREYMGRRVWRDTVDHINACPELWPVFIKPVEDKRFTGVLVRSPHDLVGCGCWKEDIPISCSKPVDFVGEWRCYVRYRKILDVRRYHGSWKNMPDCGVIESAVADYRSAPAGCALDFGLTAEGRTLLVEVNDGYALGNYGLFSIDYAKLISARWAELTGTQDEYGF